jgi:selenocysteine lyase/cysteine desulfurase
MLAIEEHEDGLRAELEQGLARLPGMEIHSRAARRTPTLLFTVSGQSSEAIAAALAQQGINAPMGSFYALEASRRLALHDRGIRVGLAPYTDRTDVTRLLEALVAFLG